MILTKKQRSLIRPLINQCREMTLSTEPSNFDLAEQEIKKIYKLSEMKIPRVARVSSPNELINSFKFCPTRYKASNKAFEKIIDKIESKYYYVTKDIKFNRRISNDITSFGYVFFNSAISMTALREYSSELYLGSIFSRQIFKILFCQKIMNIKTSNVINCYLKYSMSIAMSLCQPKLVVMCNRPKSIKTQTINGRLRLHNTSGPSVEWRDGSKYWLIEGIPVDEQIVMYPKTQTIQQINEEKFEERRRIRIEQYGWLKYLKDSGAKLINSRINERDNQKEQLYIDPNIRASNRFVCVDPSTGRKYAIAVPLEIKTCLEAQKYLSHGLDKFAIHRS